MRGFAFHRLKWVAAGACLATACGGQSASGDKSPIDAGIDETADIPVADASPEAETDARDESQTSGAVGSACQSDADCVGLHCIRSSDDLGVRGFGGPPNGYCSLDCTAQTKTLDNVVDVCAPFDSFCINFGAPGVKAPSWCLRKCELGKSAKCLGRPDIVCAPGGLVSQRSLCVPMCAQASDCPGRKCDEETGLCLDLEPQHAPLYTSCLAGAPTLCGAECVSRDKMPAGQTGPGYCTRPCSIDSATACGRSVGGPVSSGLLGYCLGSSESGVGDVGQCLQLCDTVADCLDKDPGTTCDTSLLGAAGHGVCLPPPVSAPDAGATDGSATPD